VKTCTKILVECIDKIASVQVGVLASIIPLENENKCQVVFKKTVDLVVDDIIWCDVLVCVRGFLPISLKIIQEARRAGRYIIYFLDDDLLNIPETLSGIQLLRTKKVKNIIEEIILLSDVFWCVNPHLAKKYNSFIKGKTVYSESPFEAANISNMGGTLYDTVRILYAGSTDHREIIRTYLAPALQRLCSEMGNKIQVEFIGPDPGLYHLPQINYHPYFTNYDEYRKYVTQKRFHIGLAPVYNTEFYKCKYYNKYLEYTSIGALGVYSNYEPYLGIVHNKVNGYLCENTSDGWYESIKHAVLNDTEREICYQNARLQLMTKFSPIIVSHQLSMDIPELTTFIAPDKISEQICFTSNLRSYYWDVMVILWSEKGLLSIPLIISKVFGKLYQCFSRRKIYQKRMGRYC
jgi:hypothetical protein